MSNRLYFFKYLWNSVRYGKNQQSEVVENFLLYKHVYSIFLSDERLRRYLLLHFMLSKGHRKRPIFSVTNLLLCQKCLQKV
jgi:hypothetical protein